MKKPRLLQRLSRRKSTPRPETGLLPPFPSAPKRPALHEVRVVFGPEGKGFILSLFAATYAAAAYVKAIVATDELRTLTEAGDRMTNTTVDRSRFDVGDYVIICAELQELMKYRPTAAEAAWVLPDPYAGYAASVRGVVKPRPAAPVETKAVVRDATKHDTATARKPRPAADGMTTIADIATSLGIAASKARAVLRGLKIAKPVGGWSWPSAEAEGVAARIKGEL